MKLWLCLFVILWRMTIGVCNVNAAVYIYADVVDALPGTTALVGIFAYTDDNYEIDGFNLPLEIGGDGEGLPIGFTYNSVRIQNSLFPSFNFNMNDTGPPLNFDGVVNSDKNDGDPDVVLGLSASPTKLFDLAIDINSSVLPGTVVSINILTLPPALAGALFNVSGTNSINSISIGSVTSGSITVTAVPEAAHLITAAMGVVICGSTAVSYIRRRRCREIAG